MNKEYSEILQSHKKVYSKLLSSYKNSIFSGKLSGSALSTSLTILSLSIYDKQKFITSIDNCLQWLKNTINCDGGWGDSIDSPSNITTTLICWSTLKYLDNLTSDYSDIYISATNWLQNAIGEISFNRIVEVISKIYGTDKTFSVPIIMVVAIAFKKCNNWKKLSQLPFELALFPNSFYKILNLGVVSYAIPALISIGIARHTNKPTIRPILRLIRNRAIKSSIKKLETLQPKSGGFLEAVPLTAFSVIALMKSGLKSCLVVQNGIRFIHNSIDEIGSVPIDTNLDRWTTTLSINALSIDENFWNKNGKLKAELLKGLLDSQYKKVHPFTNARKGGWGWTDLSGAVPDADDTSGALISLFNLTNNGEYIKQAIDGLHFLLSLQNRDGGMPAFCKGWGKLAFDASCPDITAHALRAFSKWVPYIDKSHKSIFAKKIKKMINFLKITQQSDGSWIPLWFGSQHTENKQNRVFGTSLVLISLKEVEQNPITDAMIEKAAVYLQKNQREDGGWSVTKNSPSTIEETSLAINALSSCISFPDEKLMQGFNWLSNNSNNFTKFDQAPIGLYFASLWYSEKLYPVIFSLGAISNLKKRFSHNISDSDNYADSIIVQNNQSVISLRIY